MAARDRNVFTWQVYVIAMSIVSLLLLGAVFLLWRSHADMTTKSNEMAANLKKSQDEIRTWDMRVKRLKSMLGYGTFTADDVNFWRDSLKDDPEVSEVEKNYVTDMAVFGPNEEKKDYRQFPISLLNTIREKNAQIDRARQVEQQLTKEKADVVASETKAREEAVKEKDQAVKDLADTREQHSQQIAKLNQEKDDIQKQVTTIQRTLEAARNDLQGKVTKLEAERKKQQEVIDSQLEKIKLLQKEDFEDAAGIVTDVAEGGTRVWINIGSNDGLREGVTFSVLDESTIDVSKAKVKADMVVEKVEAQLARCRVINPNYSKPVLPFDKVYSPSWRKGRVLGFALVGKMDIDGNLSDDRDMIRSVIERSGGKVDAEILPDGTVQGPGMNVNTKAVIVGTDVAISDSANEEQKTRAKRYAQFINDAKQLGIPQMNMERLLGFLKAENDMRTVPLGNKVNGLDFKPKAVDGVTPNTIGDVSEIFKQRNPANKTK